MKICCLDDFKNEFEKLKTNNSYRDIGAIIFDYFFNKEYDDICNGTRLNGSSTIPYIKKRLKGSGGYRVYFLLVIKNDSVFLMFVHPKSGSKGADNISPDFQASLLKKVHECILSENYYEVSKNDKNSDLTFIPFNNSIVKESLIEYKRTVGEFLD